MANSTRTYLRSFAGGEVSPEMQGRIDDNHYQTGAALIKNFWVLPQGPVVNRPGTNFIREAKYSGTGVVAPRLIPFTFSTTQTMVLEFGWNYIRFHTAGATLLFSVPAAYNGATNYVVGDLVTSGGNYYYCKANTVGNIPPNFLYWYPLPADRTYEIPSPYAAADVADIHYVQSNDVLTLVHPSYPPQELRRLGATKWTLTPITFASTIGVPTGVAVAATAGEAFTISAITVASPGVLTTPSNSGFAAGESVYISGVTGITGIPTGFYVVNTCTTTSITLKSYDTGAIINTSGSPYTVNSGKIQSSTRIFDINNFYVVTAVGTQNGQSAQSAAASAINNLNVNGAYNTITWAAVAGATRYNVYKRQSGLYGYIGQTDALAFTDNNIAPDLGTTPPITDPVFTSPGNYPGAVSYFEQRRVFAGTTNSPQQMWFTRSGTESDMTYSIPTVDTDRVSIAVAAREANTIRHIVPMTQLVLMTSAAEWRVSPVNSDAITPTTISVRPQAYVGANNVQPQIVNNSVVYCAARGGHVRELGYSWQANGYVTGDLSIRASHLFDNLLLSDLAFAKAPQQILWFISSNGKLLGLTYTPEQQIGAWHQHDTVGLFKSVCAVAEGEEDAVYVVVRRKILGTDEDYIERFATRKLTDVKLSVFTDSSLTYNGTNNGIFTVALSGGTGNWDSGQPLTLTCSNAIFQFPVGTDLNDVIVITDASTGIEYRCTITGTTSTTVAQVVVDKAIPVSLRGSLRSTYSFARTSVSGLSHLEGQTVSILADGAVVPQQVVTSGTVTVPRAASIITVGLPYTSDLQTLPMSMNTEGFGQGRMKNVNRAWLRVVQSSGIFVGPDAAHLVEAKQRTTEPYGSPPALQTAELQIVLTPTWADNGQIYVRQRDPLPLTIIGLTLEVSVGS